MERHHQIDVHSVADHVLHERPAVAVADGGGPARLLDARVGASCLEPRAEEAPDEGDTGRDGREVSI